MKVKELIKLLQEYDGDTNVTGHDGGDLDKYYILRARNEAYLQIMSRPMGTLERLLG